MNRRSVLATGAAALAVPLLPTKLLAAAADAELLDFRITRWRSDPFTLGSYSFLAKGAKPSHRRDLAKPIGRTLFFAGEATDSDYPSTVNGAYSSGIRAAKQVVKANRDRVAVVGAGMSGLAAADHLRKAGKQVTVFEARARIGGRVWTDRSMGVALDMGASWIHGATGNPLIKLAEATNTRLVESDYENYVIRTETGEEADWSDIDERTQKIIEIEHDYAADIEALSPQYDDEGEDVLGAHMIFPNGYNQLFGALDAGTDVHLGTPVQSVDYDDNGVKLTTATETADFDAAIVTVPLGVLKAEKIAFTPALPKKKRNAIKRLGMGLLDKLYLKFDRVFWDDDVEFITSLDDKPGEYTQWVNMAYYTGEPILLGFHAASEAEQLAERSDPEIVAGARNVLSKMYPG